MRGLPCHAQASVSLCRESLSFEVVHSGLLSLARASSGSGCPFWDSNSSLRGSRSDLEDSARRQDSRRVEGFERSVYLDTRQTRVQGPYTNVHGEFEAEVEGSGGLPREASSDSFAARVERRRRERENPLRRDSQRDSRGFRKGPTRSHRRNRNQPGLHKGERCYQTTCCQTTDRLYTYMIRESYSQRSQNESYSGPTRVVRKRCCKWNRSVTCRKR